MRLQSLGMGARTPLARRLSDDRRRRRRRRCPTSGSAATRIPPSSSRRWWCRPPGRAPRSRTRSSRSPSGSSASCRKRRSSTSCAASPRAGVTTIFVNLKGEHDGQARSPTSGITSARASAISATPCRRASSGPGFNDEFGDTFGIIYGFTADGFTHRELRDYVEDVRSKLLHVPDVSKIEILGAQDETHLRRVLDAGARQPGHRPLGADRARCRRRTSCSRPARSRPATRRCRCGYPAPSGPSRTSCDVNFAVGGRMLRLSDIAQVRRGYADPPQPMFRVNGEPAIGLAIAMRDGGDILALGRNIKRAMARDRPPTCRSASSRSWSPIRR